MSFLIICMLAGPLSVGLGRKSLGITFVERNIVMELQAAGSLLRSSWCLPIRGMFRCLELEKLRQRRRFCKLGGWLVQGCLVPEHVRLVPSGFSLSLSVRIIVRVCSASHAGAV